MGRRGGGHLPWGGGGQLPWGGRACSKCALSARARARARVSVPCVCARVCPTLSLAETSAHSRHARAHMAHAGAQHMGTLTAFDTHGRTHIGHTWAKTRGPHACTHMAHSPGRTDATRLPTPSGARHMSGGVEVEGASGTRLHVTHGCTYMTMTHTGAHMAGGVEVEGASGDGKPVQDAHP